MRVISLVIEGLERAADMGCLAWLFAQDADIICLQDTRCAEHNLSGEAFFPACLLYTSPSPRDRTRSRMPSSA